MLMQKLALNWTSTVMEVKRTKPRLQFSVTGETRIWSD